MMDQARLLSALEHYRNFLFDVDGTLVDSNDAHAQSFIDALGDHGVRNVSFQALRNLIGMDGESILCRVLDEETFVNEGRAIDRDRKIIFETRYLPDVKPFEGVSEVFSTLKEKGRRAALCSGGEKQITQYFVEMLGIGSMIEGIASAEHGEEGKPSPEVVEGCCSRFHFLPHETLLVGDAPYDVIAGTHSGMETLCLLSGGYRERELEKTGALAVVSHLTDFHNLILKLETIPYPQIADYET